MADNSEGAKALPKRDNERITRLCEGAIALAKLADTRVLPPKLDAYFRRLDPVPLTGAVSILPKVLESAKLAQRKPRFGNRQFLNCLLGGFRSGFNERELCASTLQAHLEQEHTQRFPNEAKQQINGFPSRSKQIKSLVNQIVSRKNIAGLHVTFHHWADLALEMWGDLISDDFRIELMIVAKDAYAITGVRNAALHRYYDSINTWQNLWRVLLEPRPGQCKRSPYQILAGQDNNSIGVIDSSSAVGKAFRRWKVWPTNSVPYLRGFDAATTPLPSEMKRDTLSINLLAYQIWLLRPRQLLLLTKDKYAIEIVHQVREILASSGFELPALHYAPHSSNSPFWRDGPKAIMKLRGTLPALDRHKLMPPFRRKDRGRSQKRKRIQTHSRTVPHFVTATLPRRQMRVIAIHPKSLKTVLVSRTYKTCNIASKVIAFARREFRKTGKWRDDYECVAQVSGDGNNFVTVTE
jgi:hypothetical protein